jgi:hypothetical protein
MADFQIAMALIKNRDFDDARKSLNTIREIDPTSDIALFAKEYEKALEKTMASYKPWRLTAGIAYQYDDNVVLKPSSSIPGVDITGESDSSIVGTFGIEYNPLLSSPWFLNARYNLYSNTYFETTSHNLLIQTVSLSPGLNFSKNALSLPLSYSHAWVDNQEYMALFTVKPTLQRAFLPQHIGQLSFGYSVREMLDEPIDRDEDRDGEIWSISAGYIHPFWNNKGIFNILYEFSQDNTDGRNWDNDGNRFVISLLMPVYKDEVKTILSGDIFLQDYKETHTVFGEKRKDKTYTGYATVIWTIYKNLNMNLQYSYTRADSNIAVYDYTRNIYTAGIEYRF